MHVQERVLVLALLHVWCEHVRFDKEAQVHACECLNVHACVRAYMCVCACMRAARVHACMRTCVCGGRKGGTVQKFDEEAQLAKGFATTHTLMHALCALQVTHKKC